MLSHFSLPDFIDPLQLKNGEFAVDTQDEKEEKLTFLLLRVEKKSFRLWYEYNMICLMIVIQTSWKWKVILDM